MDLSSGAKTLLFQGLSWAAVAGLALVGFLNYEHLRSTAGAAFGAASVDTPVVLRSQPVATMPVSSGTVELKASGNGHFETRADVNGRSIHALVDTGASIVVLTYEDARKAGIHLQASDFTQPVATANGTSYVAPVTLDRVTIGNLTVRNVRAAVADQGRLKVTLLGMSFLSQLDRVDMRDGVMVLKN